MAKFQLTKKWHRRILTLISESGDLDVFIKRTGRNQLKIFAGCDGEEIFEMETHTVRVGDVIQIKDFQTKVDMEEPWEGKA